jgi:hypothetical protein
MASKINFNEIKILKVKLISPQHPSYVAKENKFRNLRDADRKLKSTLTLNSKSGIISMVLEDIVREWISRTTNINHNRVIDFKYSLNNFFSRDFRELDYLIENENQYVLGEIKVSSSSDGMVPKASKQLLDCKKLLETTGKKIEMQIIRINLYSDYSHSPFDEFYDDFNKSRFTTILRNDITFKLLHVFVDDIFKWGIKNKLIRTPELLVVAKAEAQLLNSISNANKEISKLMESQDELTSDLSKENQERIFELKDIVLHSEVKLRLLLNGWIVLHGISENLLGKIIYELQTSNCPTEIIREAEDKIFEESDNSVRLKTFSSEMKYAIYYMDESEVDTKDVYLMDAEKVYTKLSASSKELLMQVKHTFTNSKTSKPESIALVNNTGFRKFHYDLVEIDPAFMSNEGLVEFQNILNENEAHRIVLNPMDVLIFDNHRILHYN